MSDFCLDCPDREACWLNTVTCDFAKKMQAYQDHLNQVMQGKRTNQMSNNTPKKTTAADVVEQAVEEKLVVPAQQKVDARTPEEVAADAIDEIFEEPKTGEGPELKVIEGEKGNKKSLKERVEAARALAGKHKKALVVLGIAGATTAVALYRNFKSQTDAEQVEEVTEEQTETIEEPAA